eukprot:4255484-Amphidinium_carterae.1
MPRPRIPTSTMWTGVFAAVGRQSLVTGGRTGSMYQLHLRWNVRKNPDYGADAPICLKAFRRSMEGIASADSAMTGDNLRAGMLASSAGKSCRRQSESLAFRLEELEQGQVERYERDLSRS